VVVADALAGRELLRVEADADAAAARSPEPVLLCTQDRLEHVLAAAAGDAVRWRTEATAIDADAGEATLVGAEGRRVRERAAFVVCADGIRGVGAGDAVP